MKNFHQKVFTNTFYSSMRYFSQEVSMQREKSSVYNLRVTAGKSVIQTAEDETCLKDKMIGFIGGGKITRCLVQALVHAGHPKEQIIVSNRSSGKLDNLRADFGVITSPKNTSVAQAAQVIILAVKAPIVESVARELKLGLQNSSLIISLAPGINVEHLKALSGHPNFIRSMTNTATAVGKGSTVLYTPQETPIVHKKMAEMLFLKAGKVLWINEENGIDTITPLIISSAYLYLMVEAIHKASLNKGISDEIAKVLSEQVFVGSAYALEKSQKSVIQLREEITTPNGVTEQALKVLTGANIFSLFEQAFDKAEQRSRELGKISVETSTPRSML
jgi:pyrroline-5-carboxylate reductase